MIIGTTGLALALISAAPWQGSDSEALLALPAHDRVALLAAMERISHRVAQTGDVRWTRNAAQGWVAEFEARGATMRSDDGRWTWGLELSAFGFAGAPSPAGTPRLVCVDGNRLSFERSEALTEWWVNERVGLEHGFTVQSPPARPSGSSSRPDDDTVLRFELDVHGSLRAVIAPGARTAWFENAAGEVALHYSGLCAFDATGAALDAWMEPREGGLALCVVVADAAYPVTVDPIAQTAYIKASNTDAHDRFGTDVAISGDTVVVGAFQEDSRYSGVNVGAAGEADDSAADAWAAYVFVRSGTGWIQQAYLKPSNTDAGDTFGHSVAISTDTLVVGAPGESSGAFGINAGAAAEGDNSAPSAGAVYVFVRTGATWTQEAYVKASNTGAGDEFGSSVSLSGNTLVVGAYAEDSAATGVNPGASSEADNSANWAGAAYVFVRSASTWTQEAYLKASNAEAGDVFGWDVSVSGDTVAVGAERARPGSTQAPRARRTTALTTPGRHTCSRGSGRPGCNRLT